MKERKMSQGNFFSECELYSWGQKSVGANRGLSIESIWVQEHSSVDDGHAFEDGSLVVNINLEIFMIKLKILAC